MGLVLREVFVGRGVDCFAISEDERITVNMLLDPSRSAWEDVFLPFICGHPQLCRHVVFLEKNPDDKKNNPKVKVCLDCKKFRPVTFNKSLSELVPGDESLAKLADIIMVFGASLVDLPRAEKDHLLYTVAKLNTERKTPINSIHLRTLNILVLDKFLGSE